MGSDQRIGYFGKIPARGDFVLKGLPHGFVGPWDDWLEQAIGTSRQQLGEGWLDRFLTSPVWRFVLSPSVCGEAPWAGVLMPSVDAVGRYFPLTIAGQLEPGRNPIGAFTACAPWYEQAEAIARACLDDDLELEDFDRRIAQLDRPDPTPGNGAGPGAAAARPSELLENAWRFELPSLMQLGEGCPELMRQLLEGLFYAFSLWWTEGSTRIAPTLLMTQGLPPLAGFSAMLDGEWARWRWDERVLLHTAAP